MRKVHEHVKSTLSGERPARVVGGASGRTRCIVGRLIDDADDTSRELVEAWLRADPRATGKTDGRLAKRLRSTGRSVSRSAIALHRVDECCCAPLNGTETHE